SSLRMAQPRLISERIRLQAFSALQGGRVAGETSRQCLTYSLAFAAPTSDVHDTCAEAVARRRTVIAIGIFMQARFRGFFRDEFRTEAARIHVRVTTTCRGSQRKRQAPSAMRGYHANAPVMLQAPPCPSGFGRSPSVEQGVRPSDAALFVRLERQAH